MKKIVIFGASGDVGRYFTEYLLKEEKIKDYEIIAVGGRKTDYFDSLGIKYYSVDVRDAEDFKALPGDVYAVVDFAGLMPARMEGYHPERYIDVNITGNLNILEYARLNGADRMLYSQSFGDIKDHAEDDPLLKPDLPRKFSFNTDHTVYVLTKNFMVDLMQNYHEMYGIKNFVFGLPTVYSYSPTTSYFVDGKERKLGYRLMIDNAREGKDLEVWGDPERVKDMVYIKDLCQIFCKGLFAECEGGIYNVGTGVGTSLLDQAKGMAEVFNPEGSKSNIIMRPDKPNAPEYIMDITNAREDLGYEPKYDYISMLKDFKAEMERQTK